MLPLLPYDLHRSLDVLGAAYLKHGGSKQNFLGGKVVVTCYFLIFLLRTPLFKSDKKKGESSNLRPIIGPLVLEADRQKVTVRTHCFL